MWHNIGYLFQTAWQQASVMARCAWIAAILLPAAIGVVLEWLKEPASTFSLSVWAIVALTIILALAALLYIIGKHARQLEERAETKLTILTGEDGVYRWENRQANFQEVEYRFGVKNTSESRSIENVRVVLELVKDPNDKNSMSAHRQLFSVENDQAEKTLNPKEVAHYNLVYCNKIPTSKKMNSRMRFGRSKSGAGTEVPAGPYKVRLGISAKDHPTMWVDFSVGWAEVEVLYLKGFEIVEEKEEAA